MAIQPTRKASKFTGVYHRDLSERRHGGKPDICYEITWKTPEGKKVWEKVGLASEGYSAALASKIRAEKIRDMRHAGVTGIFPVKKKAQITFASAWDIYDRDWLPNVKHANIDRCKYKAMIAPTLAHKTLDDIMPQDLEQLKTKLFSDGYAAQTVKHALALIKRVYKKLAAWDIYLGRIPTDKVIMPVINNQRTRFLTPKEVAKLLEEIKRHSVVWFRISLVSLHTGMRLSEILGLQVADIKLEHGIINLKDAKAGSRHVYMTDTIKSEIKTAIGSRTTGLVFPSSKGEFIPSRNTSKTFNRAVITLELNKGITDSREKVVFHTLRHTFASWLAMQGRPLYVIAELMGHSTLEMSRRYSHLIPDSKIEAISGIEAMTSVDHKLIHDEA